MQSHPYLLIANPNYFHHIFIVCPAMFVPFFLWKQHSERYQDLKKMYSTQSSLSLCSKSAVSSESMSRDSGDKHEIR